MQPSISRRLYKRQRLSLGRAEAEPAVLSRPPGLQPRSAILISLNLCVRASHCLSLGASTDPDFNMTAAGVPVTRARVTGTPERRALSARIGVSP